MARKSMDNKQFNDFMKNCKDAHKVRYVRPTIHGRAGLVTAIDIITTDEIKELTITNNPDENFDLNKAANEYVDSLKRSVVNEGNR